MYRYTNISFPSLGIDINPPRVFDIGPVSIHMYGLIIAFGLMLAVVYGMRRTKQFGVTEDHVLDGVLWITPFAFVCARLYYCIFEWEMYAEDPISVLYIWNGGIAIYGGVIGAVVGIILFCKIKKISLGAALDLVLLGFLIGQSIGRWGNFFNREAFGSETDTWLRMGLLDSLTGTVTYHHPTFLYESLWNAAGFVLLHFLSKRRKYDGQIALGYVVWYGLGRTFIEGLRTDSLFIPGTEIRVSQLLAASSCLIAAAVLAYFVFKPPAKKLFADRVAENITEPDEGGNQDE